MFMSHLHRIGVDGLLPVLAATHPPDIPAARDAILASLVAAASTHVSASIRKMALQALTKFATIWRGGGRDCTQATTGILQTWFKTLTSRLPGILPLDALPCDDLVGSLPVTRVALEDNCGVSVNVTRQLHLRMSASRALAVFALQ
jgi:hypothetical protein